MTVFEQLKQRRRQLGKTLDALSTLTGMRISHISSVMNGGKDAQASTLTSLADAMDATWVLVPRHLLPEVERLLAGKSVGPDAVPSTVDRLFGAREDE